MDPVRNPFAPGAGNPPPELAGRAVLLADIEVALRRIALGRPAQSSILVGLRGVGKTVLLVRMRDVAETQGFKAHHVEAHEGKTLPELLLPGMRSILYSLSVVEGAKDKARRGIRVLRSFLNGVRLKVNDVDLGLSVEAEVGSADSGYLEADLPNLFVALGEAARAASRPVLLLIDELQYLSSSEFSALIMALHKMSQLNLPVFLVGAGLPQIPGLAGESKSYAERLFRYSQVGALSDEDARTAILKPAAEEGVSLAEEALQEIMGVTERYPYFIQQWAHDAWNVAEDDRITLADVQRATPVSIAALDNDFFRVRFDRCNPSEKRYMRALASLGPGAHRSGDIASVLNFKTTSIGPTRDKLIKKGMLYSPQHGEVAFTVPLFDAYMRRVMPDLPR